MLHDTITFAILWRGQRAGDPLLNSKILLRFIYFFAAIAALFFMSRMMGSLETAIPEKLVYYRGTTGKLYSIPDISAAHPLVQLQSGTRLIFIQKRDDWYEVSDGSLSGWLPVDDVSETIPADR
jgi:hypothetical protein